MNPLTLGLRQPDPRSCGAASLVMARLVRDGAVLTPAGFRDEVLACHRRLTRTRYAGRWQLPWPRPLGTPPWAVRRELDQLTGVRHSVRLARWSRGAAFDRLAATGGVLYVGSRSLPRHVLLALHEAGEAGEALSCYQPGQGTVVRLSREDFIGSRLREAGWPHPWFTISPAGSASPAGRPQRPR